MIPKISPLQFTWQRWRSGSVSELGVNCKYFEITSPRGKRTLRKWAVGWCKGTSLHCRPKVGNVGVMFFKDEEHLWCHLTQREFDEVFKCA